MSVWVGCLLGLKLIFVSSQALISCQASSAAPLKFGVSMMHLSQGMLFFPPFHKKDKTFHSVPAKTPSWGLLLAQSSLPFVVATCSLPVATMGSVCLVLPRGTNDWWLGGE